MVTIFVMVPLEEVVAPMSFRADAIVSTLVICAILYHAQAGTCIGRISAEEHACLRQHPAGNESRV